MTKQEISSLLNDKHQLLFNWLDKQAIDKWEKDLKINGLLGNTYFI